MNRRGFFGAIGAALAGPHLGKIVKKLGLTRTASNNKLLTMKEFYEKYLPMSRYVDRDFGLEFGNHKHRIGQTINIRVPKRFIGRDGGSYSPESIIDDYIPILITESNGDSLNV